MLSQDQNKVFLVDFGLAARYQDAEGAHVKDTGAKNSFKGTVSYASVNAHEFRVRNEPLTNLGTLQARRSLELLLHAARDGGRVPALALRRQALNCKTRPA